MCLFIMADGCHVRHALSHCKVSHAISFSCNSAVDQIRKHLLEDEVMGEVYDGLNKEKKNSSE